MTPGSMNALVNGMSAENRALWEQFNSDARCKDVVITRSMQGVMLSQARASFADIAKNRALLNPQTIEGVRSSLLQLLQMQDSMETMLAEVPSEYADVKARIREDYDVTKELAYMAKLNNWLDIVNGKTLG
jgi:hypothetical protein